MQIQVLFHVVSSSDIRIVIPHVMGVPLLFIVTVVKTEHFFDVQRESCAKMEILIMVFIN